MLQGSSNLPVAPKGTPWNAKAAKERVLEACGGNVACISRAFLWRGAGDARSPDAWSLGFCDVIDGRLHIVPKGIAACAGARGIGSFALDDEGRGQVQARISAIYDRVRRVHEDWPASPFQAITADASGTPVEGVVALEGIRTGDNRFVEKDALTWDEGPWPLVFDLAEMDHTAATVGTINTLERRATGDYNEIWATGNLSASENPEVQALVTRAEELFTEGAVGVSMTIDDDDSDFDETSETFVVRGARIRAIAIVDVPAFAEAKMSLAAAIRPTSPEAFADPGFGNGSRSPFEDGGDERLVWQEPEASDEQGQYGCPFTINDDGTYYGHLALWGRCHVGYPGTCVRPPKEAAAYRGYLTGERVPGIPTGPLVMKTTHASLKVAAEQAQIHYDHTGFAAGDNVVGPDAYGIWVAGQLRPDVTEADIEILRGSALSGDWRIIGGQMKLVGVLVVNAPGFRVSRAMAASAALLTVGPGCSVCAEEHTLEDRVARLEELLSGLPA